jgi:hypothetical protein
MCPLHPLNPFVNTDILFKQTVAAHFFPQLTNTAMTLRALIIARSGVHCGLKYQHCLMKQKLCLTRKVSGVLYPYKSDKSNVHKSEILINIDVYSYMSTHRRASCSAGVICRGCGVVTCKTVVNLLKTSWHPRITAIRTAATS